MRLVHSHSLSLREANVCRQKAGGRGLLCFGIETNENQILFTDIQIKLFIITYTNEIFMTLHIFWNSIKGFVKITIKLSRYSRRLRNGNEMRREKASNLKSYCYHEISVYVHKALLDTIEKRYALISIVKFSIKGKDDKALSSNLIAIQFKLLKAIHNRLPKQTLIIKPRAS